MYSLKKPFVQLSMFADDEINDFQMQIIETKLAAQYKQMKLLTLLENY